MLLASAPVLHWLRSNPGDSTPSVLPICPCCGSTVLGSTPRNSATTTISSPPRPPPIAMPRPPPPPPLLDVVLVSICMPSLKVIAQPPSTCRTCRGHRCLQLCTLRFARGSRRRTSDRCAPAAHERGRSPTVAKMTAARPPLHLAIVFVSPSTGSFRAAHTCRRFVADHRCRAEGEAGRLGGASP